MDLTPEWRRGATCRDAEEDMICVTPTEAEALIAKYCRHCPVRPQCAACALAMPTQTVGIWGGAFLPAPEQGSWQRRMKRESIAALRAERATLGGDAVA